MNGVLVLDSGALIALTKRSPKVWALLDRAQRSRADVLVPAGTLAESLRGGPRDTLINQLLDRPRTQVTIHDEERARRAGRLLDSARTSDAIDALVVAEALRHDEVTVVTSDPDDIAELVGIHDVTIVEV